MDLFDASGVDNAGLPLPNSRMPLPVRMRPKTIDEVLGQDHLLVPGSPLRRLLSKSENNETGVTSLILWGPAGTGKTTLAYLVAQHTGQQFFELSAVSAGVKEVRQVIESARRRLTSTGEETILFIDEVHRFSRTQQDALLPAVENRWVTLVAATTENPSFSVVSPLLSRSLMLTLHPLEESVIRRLVERALIDERGLAGKYALEPDSLEVLIRSAGADARKALTILEAAAGSAATSSRSEINATDIKSAVEVALVRYGEDQHYDVASAFIKSMRGSHVDAALHYLARMLEAGEDPRFIARRVMIAAAEDVGLADPSILPLTVAAAQAVALVGMPEARIILAEAVVAVATAPKSNASYLAIGKALKDVQSGLSGNIPPHLRDSHSGAARQEGYGDEYLYAHDYPHGVVAQAYLPETLQDAEYYIPTNHGYEAQLTKRLQKVREILRMS